MTAKKRPARAAGKTSAKAKRSAGKAPAKKRASGGSKASSATATESGRAFPIVGIGASAGGLEALVELLENMPVDTGMAFVVVTHQHPGHKSMLPELLRKETEMPVVEAADGTKVQANRVYVGPPGGHLAILNGVLHRMETEKNEAPRSPIDSFFRSLAEDRNERAICIVLSGTGADGTIGLKAIKGASGMAMAEKPEAAKYAGMPSSAIATGLVDYVLTPAAMPKQLVAYAAGPCLNGAAVAAEEPPVPAAPMQKIFLLLRSRTGNDFSAYKSNTLRRRIERRMNVHRLERPNQYVRYLQENPHEIDALFRELLISVTSFFRDPAAWDALNEAIQKLMRSRPDNYTLRAWVPGCATGEEAFSLAISLREALDSGDRRLDAQIFGTDLDVRAIETARTGKYPDGIAGDVSPDRLKRFFTHGDDAFRIRKEIREMTIFAPQNVIKDPPFTKLDILSCRNLLIYLNADLQKKLLPIFHYALKPGGLLFLGPSETIGSFTDLFEPVDKRWKIYRRKECATDLRPFPDIPAQPWRREDVQATAAMPDPKSVKETRISTILERFLLGRFAPASVVVNDRGDIIYIHGRTGAYLEPTSGQPRSNVLEMAREGLQIELSAALRQCAAKDADVVREDIRVKTNGHFIHIDLSVSKLREPESVRDLLLVTFRPAPAKRTSASAAEADAGNPAPLKGKSAAADRRVKELELELRHARESRQATQEELETSNEELKSTNEELQSTNEELQSANEELETSKEEMQSLNEELTTVNAELQSKVDDLSESNNDMQNLLNSTDVATLFLDNQLNIKRFTDQARDLVMLRPTDVGRPISELASNLEDRDLTGACRQVLKTLVFQECEVRTLDGHWYLMRIMPYRTTENVIDGLVITFVSIQRLKAAESVGELRSFFESIVETVHQPLLALDDKCSVASANKSFYKTFRLQPKQVLGAPFFELGNKVWDIPELRQALEEVLPANMTLENFVADREFPGIGKRAFTLNARRLRREQGQPGMILLAMEDITPSRKK